MRLWTGRSAQLVAGTSLALACLTGGVQAQSVESFYRGKTVTIVVGNSAGGGYDLNARLLSRHMGRHLPGNPTMVVQNMPGAGGVTASNYLYTVAAKDGTVFGTVARIVLIEPLFTKQNFVTSEFSTIGSISKDISTCISWKTSQVKTWNDFVTKDFVAAGQAVGADPDAFANMIRNVFGAKIKLVTGFPGTAEMSLAMERGEVDGFCGISYSTLKSRQQKWLQDKSINILVQNAIEKHPDLPGVPLITELTKDKDTLGTVRLIVATQNMARPFIGPPKIPADRLAALRAAFDATMADKEFVADADKSRADVSPMTAAEMDKLLAELLATPKPIVERAAKAMATP